MKKKYREGQFTPAGVGLTYKQKPVSVMLPPELDAFVRSLPNRSEFIREAIAEKIEKEGPQPSLIYSKL